MGLARDREWLERPAMTKFVQLVQFLERNLERGGDTTPLRLLLSKMRPRMVQVRPPRRNTVKRQFCRPFEELLYNTKSLVPVDGRIPRNAIEGVYRLYEEESDKAQLAGLPGQRDAVDVQAWLLGLDREPHRSGAVGQLDGLRLEIGRAHV